MKGNGNKITLKLVFFTVKELMDGVDSHLDGPNQLNMDDFVYLEDQLQGALLETRARMTHLKTAAIMKLEEKGKMLIEENRLLAKKIAMVGEKMDEGNAQIDLNETPRSPKLL